MIPWKLRRLGQLLAINNIKYVGALFKAIRDRYKFTVVISTRFYGGVGGTEKLLQSVVDSMPKVFFIIYAEELRLNGFRPSFNNYIVNPPLKIGGKHSIYLYFCGGGKPPYLGDQFEFKTKIVDTNAANIDDIFDKFDFVAIQSTMFDDIFNGNDKKLYAFPEIEVTLPKKLTPPPHLPDKYLLTIFNPFSARQKGHDIIAEVANRSCLPIIWCYSDKSGWDFDDLPRADNLIHMKNLTQEEIYFLYRKATAYLHLAHYESYGYTLAEAFHHNLPIIARDTGIISFVKTQPGIHLFESKEDLLEIVSKEISTETCYDHTWIKENSYASVFEKIALDIYPLNTEQRYTNTPTNKQVNL